MIEIETSNGIIKMKSINNIGQKHWDRIEELCSTAAKPEALQTILIAEVMRHESFNSYLDLKAFQDLEESERQSMVQRWLQADSEGDDWETLVQRIQE